VSALSADHPGEYDALGSEGATVILLVSGATADIRKADPSRVGMLFTPANRNSAVLARGRRYAIDNGAYVGFNPSAFLKLLARFIGVPGCLFVACPDVVGDWAATQENFQVWAPLIRSLGFPVALVAQDGLTSDNVPWLDIDALFVGGTTQFKLSADVDVLLGEAEARGKWRHIGRVNTKRRMRHFRDRCDSFDGSCFSRWPKRIKQALAWLDEHRQQPMLISRDGVGRVA
jgi:hypothetical protein